jgi:glycosyltransferase involved in cell wall biosynthesis
MKNSRTILFLHPSSELYGADRTLLQLIQGLDTKRWEAVVAMPQRGQLATELEQAGATVTTCELGLGERASLSFWGVLKLVWTVPKGAWNTWRLARRYRPAVIHTNTMIVLGGAIGARLSGFPHLWHIHEILENPRWLAKAYSKLMCLLAHRVVSNSQATRQSFDRWCHLLSTKHGVVLNGVDSMPTKVQHTGDDLRRSLGVSDEEQLVLLPGRINSWKGQSLLVDAASTLQNDFPNARYLLAGSAPAGQLHFEEELDQLIQARGLESVVLRVPFQADVSQLYEAADVCCVPSIRPEPFGLVAIEAMAAGKPVVASNHGGLAEIVEPGVTGLLFEPCNVLSLAQALQKLLVNPELAKSLGAAGRGRQVRRFGVERYCSEFERHYQQVALDAGYERISA